MLSAALQDAKHVKRFRRQLLGWYSRHKRDLHWRGERDPYRIWVSEIMLQQTRVSVVTERYRRFLKRFPTVKKLAGSPLSRVLAEWSGLGYYRRARNLHAAARQLQRRKERIPRRASELQKLPGIGRYTAAAIASIAFAEPVAAVDGNVERVLSRLLAPGAPDCWKAATELLARDRPGDFNQAMMELGATVCLPGQPNCPACPVSSFCALKQGRQEFKARLSQVRIRKAVAYELRLKRGRVLLVRRDRGHSLMPGLWELPASAPQPRRVLLRLHHSITNTDYEVSVNAPADDGRRPAAGKWFLPGQLSDIPITGLTRKILKRARVLGHQS